jgi:hypothetical protein
VWYVIVRYTLEQRVFLYDTYVTYGSTWKRRRKFRDERVPSRQTIHNLVNKLRIKGLSIEQKQKHKRRVLTEEKLDDIVAKLKHTPRKSLKCLAQETGVSKSSARTATQLLKRRPYRTTVIHALQPRDSASRVRFCSWFLQFVVGGEIDPQLTFFSDEAWFYLQGYKTIATGVHRIHMSLIQPCSAQQKLLPGVQGILDLRYLTINVTMKVCIRVCESKPILSAVNIRRKTVWLVSARLGNSPHCTYICAGFVWRLLGQKYQQRSLASTFPDLNPVPIQRQNSYSSRSQRCTGRREAKCRETANKSNNFPVYSQTIPNGETFHDRSIHTGHSQRPADEISGTIIR